MNFGTRTTLTAPSAADLHATVRTGLGLLSSMVACGESHTLSSTGASSDAHAALDALLARCEEAEEDYRIVKALRSGCACGDDEACAFVRRAEAAERERDEAREEWYAYREQLRHAEARVAELEAALQWYAEPRNYRSAAGSPPCAMHGTTYCEVVHTDSWDGGGPGTRARAALQSGGSGG